MDFLDSHYLDSPRKKCNKVRSWYLYEQYKSLEKNQLDAAFRLKNKSYQERLLRQELNERRARRSLCDQFGKCHSESKLDRINSTSQVPLSISDDDLFESLCEFQEEYELDAEDNYSQYSASQNFEDYKSTESKKYDSSYTDILESAKVDGCLDSDIKNELEIVKQNIAENITLQLETVKENIESLEKYVSLDEDKSADENVIFNDSDHDVVSEKKYLKSKNCVLSVWSKMVAFAYKILQLNHGNCYYDYSSQLLTAVLACDVLRQGVSNMCHYLQPYVSPIKFTTSEINIPLEHKHLKRKKYYKTVNDAKYNRRIKNHKKFCGLARRYKSENLWDKCSRSLENCINDKHQGASEPCRSNIFGKEITDKYKYQNSFMKCKSKQNICKCRYLKRVVKPMLQLVRYIDSLLQDIEQ